MRQVRFEKLALDAHAARGERAEFVAGERFPLPPESRAHQIVAQNLFLPIAERLAGTGLAAHLRVLPVRIDAADALYFPDLVVVDGEGAPVLVAEVTAPQTAAVDRREKWLCYQLLPGLREVVLVGHAPREVEVRRRGRDEAWTGEIYERGETAWLDTVELGIAVDAIYAGIDGLTFA
jgi:Uma2 family endonuclease